MNEQQIREDYNNDVFRNNAELGHNVIRLFLDESITDTLKRLLYGSDASEVKGLLDMIIAGEL